jgi:hypothetical protein
MGTEVEATKGQKKLLARIFGAAAKTNRISVAGGRMAHTLARWRLILGVFIVSVVLMFVSGVAASSGEALRIGAALLALAFAAALFGCLLGLLFGMPRIIEMTDTSKAKSRFVSNNNLIKVSDWITTIVIGLSLVNLGRIPKASTRFSAWVQPALGDRPASGTIGVFMVVVGLVGAFISTYVWTIVVLRGDLEQSELDIDKYAVTIANLAKDLPTQQKQEDLLQSQQSDVLAAIAANPQADRTIVEAAKKIQATRASTT